MATLLIVDDSDTARAEIKSVVESAEMFDRILEADNGVRGLKLILSESLDMVICDLEMPGFDGEKLLRAVESNPELSNTPFIVVTASDDQKRRTRLLESGASDVVCKPFNGPDLAARLQLQLKLKRLQDELRIKNETLARISTSDPTTGLRTRRFISEFLSIEILRARRYKTPVSVIMADLDLFKKVNDTFGHLAGDAVLKGTAGLLLSELRATDAGGRFGGEEFLIVLNQCDQSGAKNLAERWRGAVENADFSSSDGRSIPVTISLGIAQFTSSMTTPADLVEAADKALYRAKDSGRNRVECAVPD